MQGVALASLGVEEQTAEGAFALQSHACGQLDQGVDRAVVAEDAGTSCTAAGRAGEALWRHDHGFDQGGGHGEGEPVDGEQ